MMHTHYCNQINLKFAKKGDIYSLKVLDHKNTLKLITKKDICSREAWQEPS